MTQSPTAADTARLFIGGAFRPALKTIPVTEAATGQLLADGPCATESDIDDAVAAAHERPAEQWRTAPPAERAAALNRFAAALRSRAADTATLVCRENGMPITLSRPVNGVFPGALVAYYAKMIKEWNPEEIRSALVGHTIVRREPVGVVGAITPWNYPQSIAIMKIAPALAAGCPVVLKAAPETALDALIFAEAAADAELPAGVLNIVPGDAAAGAHLVTHPGIDKVAFTGSTNAGRLIGAECGRLIKPVTLELGGKSAAVVLDDADLEATIAGLRTVSFANNGQTCHLSARILVPHLRYAEFIGAIGDLANGMKVGDPLHDDTEIGPLVSARQRDTVLEYIEIGRESEARLIAGGSVPSDQPRGWFVAPTVFADVDNQNRLAREEIFGPVVTITPYGDEAEAIQLANDTEFGLAGTVWSQNDARARDVARAMHTGSVGINHYQLDIRSPFGGVKSSGLGRELGPEGLQAYRITKSMYCAGPIAR
ncbi:aldehyde dehydrogenase [Mycolicibacterium holsaticum]|uniref:Aldehyde dehydrogenase n=1 Tax=Mycolicibacterium holsaticum TaxID=152142 RepID=A0A1E3RXL5_9MYCO|nr:aldehyde dehydrogenase [Mycolicibacterium holsaticum]ODQ94097.1 aldehyde dehydrogenase [Mycolicibacterium holsaticum]